MFKEIFDNVRTKKPLIHNITNYVTVNDCANILLACGGSPIMASDENEVEDITSICNGLNINIGTLNSGSVNAMIKAGKKANELNHPVILDPVGTGAAAFRTATALKLLSEIHFDVIKGNISEIKVLALGTGKTLGVDANTADNITSESLDDTVLYLKKFAAEIGSVIIVTGAIDIVTDGKKAFCIYNGEPEMGRITGTGCQLSALTAAFITANPEDKFTASAAAVCAMGLAGEIGKKRMSTLDGNASYRNYIIDAIYNMTGDQLEEGARFEIK